MDARSINDSQLCNWFRSKSCRALPNRWYPPSAEVLFLRHPLRFALFVESPCSLLLKWELARFDFWNSKKKCGKIADEFEKYWIFQPKIKIINNHGKTFWWLRGISANKIIYIFISQITLKCVLRPQKLSKPVQTLHTLTKQLSIFFWDSLRRLESIASKPGKSSTTQCLSLGVVHKAHRLFEPCLSPLGDPNGGSAQQKFMKIKC